MTDQYLSVKALTQYLKRKFDVDPHLQKVHVVGEISNYRHRPNAHQYFSLKDDGARISAVIYKSTFNKIPFQLEEGMKVLAIGRVTLFEPSGQYQLTIESVQPDGVGALYQALAQLKEKFQKAGLFEQLQRPIPKFPKRIAVITSPTGAVIRDILTTIKRRYPIVDVTIFPTRVQGKESVAEIVAAFGQVTQRSEQFDTVILARGGGSIEDLWSFNEEAVAQAILTCPIPIISSIGHETDTTIADLVADLRAPTPTAAAELAVPVLSDILAYLSSQTERLLNGINNQLMHKRKQLTKVEQSYILAQPERLYQAYSQEVDNLTQQLNTYQQRLFKQKEHQLHLLQEKLLHYSPEFQIKQEYQRVENLKHRLGYAMNMIVSQQEQAFKQLVVKLEAFNPLSILARGYSIVSTTDTVVKSIDQVTIGQEISIRMADGLLSANVTATKEIKKEELYGN